MRSVNIKTLSGYSVENPLIIDEKLTENNFNNGWKFRLTKKIRIGIVFYIVYTFCLSIYIQSEFRYSWYTRSEDVFIAVLLWVAPLVMCGFTLGAIKFINAADDS